VTKDNGQDAMRDATRKARATTASHVPSKDEAAHMDEVRGAGAAMIGTLMVHVPAGADRQAAIRKVREAVMTANSGIALRGTDPTRD